MKTLGLKIVLVFLCFIGISAKCTADIAYPNFEFGYQDNTLGHTYQIDFYIQNTAGTPFGPWFLGTQVIVRVQRDDGQTRYGISDWADLAGLASGSLVCPVDHF